MILDSRWVFYPLNVLAIAILVYYPPPNDFSLPALIVVMYLIGYIARGRREKRKEDSSDVKFAEDIQ